MMIDDTVILGRVRARMLSRTRILVLGCLLAAPAGFLSAQIAPGETGPQTIDPAELERAFDALYNLDLDRAAELFRQMTVLYPENPRSWSLLASGIMVEALFEQQKLSLDSYSGDRIGTDDSSDEIDREREARFRQTIERAVAAAEAILERNPDDLQARYDLGSAWATLAAFEATIRKSVTGAAGPAKKAHDLHMEVLRRDPSFNDARLAVGTYEYAAGVLPWLIRQAVKVFGIRGDKEVGIAQLRYAAELGRWVSTDARLVLVVVYNRERWYEDALEILEQVHREYPRNYLVEIEMATVYGRMSRWPAAIATYQSVLTRIENGVDGYERLEPQPVRFKLAEAHVHGEKYLESIPIFEAVIADPESSDGIRCRSHLWAGQILNDRARGEEASEHFRAVQRLDCTTGQKRQAGRYL
jgi:tetratricopeptide (TPR) repeat protein